MFANLQHHYGNNNKYYVHVMQRIFGQTGFCKFRGPAVGADGGYVIAPAFELKILLNLLGLRECVYLKKLGKVYIFKYC